MPEPLFYLFSVTALVCAALVIFKRDPLISAIFLILTLCNIAAIYLFFGAGFLAAIQVIVYAGAVMVLFLFIIMLLQSGQEREEGNQRYKASVVAAALIFGTELILVMLGAAQTTFEPVPQVPGTVGTGSVTVATIGELLFGRFLVPLELVSFLLLVAVVGVVMLTGSDAKKESRAT